MAKKWKRILRQLSGLVMTLRVRKFKNTFFPALGYLSLRRHGSSKHSLWADHPDSSFNTAAYESVDNENSQLLLAAIRRVTTPEDSILDLCCNQGRYLRALWGQGYRKLFGFDIMKSAVDHFNETYRFKMKEIKIVHSSFCDFFKFHCTNDYDFAITMSATLELIEPQERIFEKIAQSVRKGAVFMLHEDGHSYPRFWSYGFEKNGLSVLLKQKTRSGCTLFILAKEKYAAEISNKLDSIYINGTK
jgi:SAM-dependent methyltransferase